MNKYKRAVFIILCSVLFTFSMNLSVFAWEMEGNINPVTGNFTHDFITEQALRILLNDWYGNTDDKYIMSGLGEEMSVNGLGDYYYILSQYKSELEHGSRDADRDRRSRDADKAQNFNKDFEYSSHFYDPDTKKTWYLLKENLTSEVQAERNLSMAIALFKEAETSEARAKALIAKAETDLDKIGLGDLEKSILVKYRETLLKSNITSIREDVENARINLGKYKNAIPDYTDGVSSTKQLEGYEYLNSLLQFSKDDLERVKKESDNLKSDYKTKEDKYLKLQYMDHQNDVYKKAEAECQKAKEFLENNQKRQTSLNKQINECLEKLKSFDEKKVEDYLESSIKLEDVLKFEKAAQDYEKAILWYETLLNQKNTPLSKDLKGMDSKNYALFTACSEAKRTSAQNDIKKAEDEIAVLERSVPDSSYKKAVSDYIGKLKSYKEAVLNYSIDDLTKGENAIRDLLGSLPADKKGMLVSYKEALDAYRKSQNKYADAVYRLGYGAHFFADMTNPHHAANNIIPAPPYSHNPFEALFTMPNQEKFQINSADKLMQNKYDPDKIFVDKSDCYKLSNYNDLNDGQDLYEFIQQGADVLARVGKDYYYSTGFEKDKIAYSFIGAVVDKYALKDLSLAALYHGLSNKEFEDIKSKWSDAAEKTLGAAQVGTAKLFLKFFQELEDSEKLTVVTKTSNNLSAATKDSLYLKLQTSSGEKSLILNKNNDIIDECQPGESGDSISRGETSVFSAYINKKWYGSRDLSSVSDLKCSLELKKNGLITDDWTCEDASLIYQDRYLLGQSEGEKTLNADGNNVLKLIPPDAENREMDKVTLRFRNSIESTGNINFGNSISFGVVNGNSYGDVFELSDPSGEKFKPGNTGMFEFYIPKESTGEDDIKSCWIEQNTISENCSLKLESAEVYKNDLPLYSQYFENGRTIRNEKFYLATGNVLELKVKTCSEMFAGTDNQVSFYIVSNDGVKSTFKLDKKQYNDFERGACDTYLIDLGNIPGIKGIGDIKALGIMKNCPAVSDDWKCQYVEAWLDGNFLTYKYLNTIFDKENPSSEWDASQKLYAVITDNNGGLISDENVYMNLKSIDGNTFVLKNPDIIEIKGRKAYEFNAVGENGNPIDLRRISEVWMDKSDAGISTIQGCNTVQIYTDKGLNAMSAYHSFNGNPINEHFYVCGLLPSEDINVTVEFQTEEKYEDNSSPLPQSPTYLVLETDVPRDGRNVNAEIRCVPGVNSKKADGMVKTYKKTYTAEFTIKNPAFLLPNIKGVHIEKRLNNESLSPIQWDISSVNLKLQGYEVKVIKMDSYSSSTKTGINYMVDGM